MNEHGMTDAGREPRDVDETGDAPRGEAPPHILVVGGSPATGTILHDVLAMRLGRVEVVGDGATARDLLARVHHDLVILLLPLPAEDGVAVCGRLRAADEGAGLLVVDAAGSAEGLISYIAAGADTYLAAPVAAAELHARCNVLLRRRALSLEDATAPAVPLATSVASSASTAGTGARARSLLSMTRNKLTRVAAAAALILVGAFGAHALQTPQTAAQTVAAASASAAPVSAAAAAPSAASINAATENAFAIAGPSVVYVDNVGIGSGSGVIYDSTGDIVTNAHVVAQAQSLKVTLASGKTYTARLVGTDVADDLAVIHINATGLPAARFAPAGSVKVAETVLAIGSPLGLQESVTSGLVSALGRTVQESTGAYLPNAVQTSAPINPGNSGGALVTLNGTVVGIPTLEASDPQNNNGGAAQGIGFAVPSSRVTYVANQIIATGTVAHTGRAYLGVTAVDSSAVQQQSPYGNFGGGFGGGATTPAVEGALVEQVGTSTPAAQAGLQQGDVITAANGTTITGESDLLSALAAAKPGQTITLTIDRNGQTMTVKATLGELPAS